MAGRTSLLVGLWPSSPGRKATSSGFFWAAAADRASDSCPSAMEFISAVAVSVACLRLVLQNGGATLEGEWPGGFLSPCRVSMLPAAQGVRVPRDPQIPCLWT